MSDTGPKKQVVGLLGEMSVAMVLHERGWQVYRPVLDENIDFVLTRYYCADCKEFTELFVRNSKINGTWRKAVTNLCATCEGAKVRNIVRFIQVKTSDGVRSSGSKTGSFSFHAKLRHHVDPRTFYIWAAVHPGERIDKRTLCYYVFHHSDVARFDNLELASYQKTDNQKIALRINDDCDVENQGRIHSYDCFGDFLDNFAVMDEILAAD